MSDSRFVWQDERPAHSFRRSECGTICQGHWKEVRGVADCRGWVWICDRPDCQFTPRAAA